MNWDAIGAAAELIGAGAVLVTLVYLAIQTRDNVRVSKARAAWDAQMSFVEVNRELGDGGVLSQVVFRGMTGRDDLTDFEKYQVHRFARGWFQRMEAQFALYRAGILDEEVWQLRRGYARAILQDGMFREVWDLEKSNSMFTEDFIESVAVGALPGFLGGTSLGAGLGEEPGSNRESGQ